MILLSGFSMSAVLVIMGIYLLITLAIFGFLMIILVNNIEPFKLFLKKYKNQSKGKYYGILLLLYIACSLIVHGFLYLRYLNSGHGFLQ